MCTVLRCVGVPAGRAEMPTCTYVRLRSQLVLVSSSGAFMCSFTSADTRPRAASRSADAAVCAIRPPAQSWIGHAETTICPLLAVLHAPQLATGQLPPSFLNPCRCGHCRRQSGAHVAVARARVGRVCLHTALLLRSAPQNAAEMPVVLHRTP